MKTVSAPSSMAGRSAELTALAGTVRPELHRYCARLMGSVIDGEDVVQDTIVRALDAVQELDTTTPLRPWLFRIAHNRALDLLRSRALRRTESVDTVPEVPDFASPDPEQILMREQAVRTAVSRFTELPLVQRSVVILKDVLDESLVEIAAMLDLSIDGVKGHLARGRSRLRDINSRVPLSSDAPPTVASDAVLQYVALFNRHDWDGLRALLADDVKLVQSSHAERTGRADVGQFFTLYSMIEGVWLAPAMFEGREVIAVFDRRDDAKPRYMMWIEWRDGRIVFIHDYRYVPYVLHSCSLQI